MTNFSYVGYIVALFFNFNLLLISTFFLEYILFSDYNCIDEISKEKIEELKREIRSRLVGMDYETYIKQFWVGLLEGDGTITVSSPGANHIKVRIIISIKNIQENLIMLLLIQEVLGGKVRMERQSQYVTWVATSLQGREVTFFSEKRKIAIRKDLIESLIKVLNEYPLLTTRKQCQLNFAIKCMNNGTKEFVEKKKSLMYQDQGDLLQSFENHFVIPHYFPAWLSGFVEAEGCFRFLYDKRRGMKESGRFNIGQNFEHFIIKAIRDYFKANVKIQTIISQKSFSEKRKSLGQVKHFYFESGDRFVKMALFRHFDNDPLLGFKRVSYFR